MLHQDQKIFDLILNSISEAIIIVDEDQNIVETNDSGTQMFGYNKGELIKKPLNILIPQNYHSNHDSHFKAFTKKQKRYQMGKGRDICGVHKDGSRIPIEAGLNPFKIYGKNFIMALIVDISIRKEHEQESQKLNSLLEEKVVLRTKELEISVKKLKGLNIELDNENKRRIKAEQETRDALKKERELNELKTKFLSMVSHEFKTPLSGILTSAILLSKYKLSEQQQKRDKHIKTISDKVYYLNNILNDFLSIEQLEKGMIIYSPSTFKLSKVVNEVIYSANMLLKDGQKINYPVGIDSYSLYQDEKIVQLTFSNVVHNAIKYSSENTIIDIFITQDDKKTIFKIKDNGIGIPKKDQKNIFKRYFRAENALLTQGTGIGLNIVKNHLENLDGRIYFESEVQKGSSFIIELPNYMDI